MRRISFLSAWLAVALSLTVVGASDARVLRGDAGADRLAGTRNADRLYGFGGRDRLYPGRGRDRSFGGPGRDRILDDGGGIIHSGPGRDHITIRAAKLNFTVRCGSGRDRAVIRIARRYRRATVRKRLRSCEQRDIKTRLKDVGPVDPGSGSDPSDSSGSDSGDGSPNVDDGATAQEAGKVNFIKYAGSDFDAYTWAPSPAQAQWMRDHFWRMQVYSSYFDTRTSWYPNGLLYRDLYAIYRNEDLAQTQPQWVLRDRNGRALYIPWGCGGGICPQYAGDVGSPAFRRWWIDEARARLARGSYRGLWVDDMNLHFAVSDGHGNHVDPIDPRTGRAMTHDDWKRYVAEFAEQIRRELPGLEINHNSVWFAAREQHPAGRDPAVRRQIAASDLITLERGIVDEGLTGGTGTWSLHAVLEFVDQVHAQGASVIMHSYADSRAEQTYQLAGYYLISTGADAMGDSMTRPDRWWEGYETDLGAAAGERSRDAEGLWQRRFAGGLVLLNEPGAPIRTVPLSETMCDLDNRRVTRVTLPARTGQVLRFC